MVDKASDKPDKKRTCKCGARTPEEHRAAILAGYRVHTWSGPKPKAK